VRKGRDSAAAFMRCSKTISGAFHYPGNQLDLAAADILLETRKIEEKVYGAWFVFVL
jgi:hypothetical protein